VVRLPTASSNSNTLGMSHELDAFGVQQAKLMVIACPPRLHTQKCIKVELALSTVSIARVLIFSGVGIDYAGKIC
jgi:hypothetical protein